jgi:nucleoside phosphorylase
MANPNGMMLTAAGVVGLYRPRYLILCGVCYGLDEERQDVGDVLVSQRVHDIDHRALIDGKLFNRGVNVPPSTTLLDRLKATTAGADLPFRVHFGPMLSSATLVNSPPERAALTQQFPNALGGDMEGAAVYGAAAKDGIEWIVVKGISDWGRQKTYGHQATAAENAAMFVVRTLQLGSLQNSAEASRPGGR